MFDSTDYHVIVGHLVPYYKLYQSNGFNYNKIRK